MSVLKNKWIKITSKIYLNILFSPVSKRKPMKEDSQIGTQDTNKPFLTYLGTIHKWHQANQILAISFPILIFIKITYFVVYRIREICFKGEKHKFWGSWGRVVMIIYEWPLRLSRTFATSKVLWRRWKRACQSYQKRYSWE